MNALLTQLDQLRRFPNVMVLTTSNITEAIDVAFVDRADIKVGYQGCSRTVCLQRAVGCQDAAVARVQGGPACRR